MQEDEVAGHRTPPNDAMTPTDTYLGLRAFTDELARCGITDACTSPGSRSTPLVLSLAREPRLRATSHLDERSGAFFALGLAKATGRPAVLACTSGTAAANYAPAVIEAYEARVPLLVLTADRPPELRDLGAGQTIDQVKLFGRAAKWFLEVDDAPATPQRLRWLRQLACRAVHTAVSGRPGPVHLNFALREPLVLEAELPPAGGGRAGGRPWVDVRPAMAVPDGRRIEALARALHDAQRPLVVAGRLERAGAGEAVAAFARRLRVPLLADPLSGARRGEAIAHYDAYLRDAGWAAAHQPDLVLRIGDLPTSKPLRTWLAGLPDDVRQVALDPEAAWQDPSASVHEILPADPVVALAILDVAPNGEEWLGAWRRADAAAIEAFGRMLSGPELSEPLVAARTAARLAGRDALVVAASMPVRDLETFMVAVHSPPRVLANRGANGIDGTASTALGVAAATAGTTVLLTGDVALLHDLGGLLATTRAGVRLVVVLIDNDGGGIFHFLPVATQADHFTEHVATPHGIDFAAAAALYGLGHELAEDLAGFDAALERAYTAERSTIVQVRTARNANVELHRNVWAAVAESVRRGA
jgi:2-succinyl-5-enolpyruvyl-6-hydroxy-3-cyclohexene-1-carboxylate synthase